jgi:hypothetical protein
MSKRIQELQDQRRVLQQERSKGNKEARAAPASALAGIAVKLVELEAQDHLLESQINMEQHLIHEREETEKHQKAEKERTRKQGIIESMTSHRPKCTGCGRSDKMKRARNALGELVPPSFSVYSEEVGWTTACRWSLTFVCTHLNCPKDGMGQRVYPEELEADKQ